MAATAVYYVNPVNFSATFTTGVTATDGSGALTSPTWWGAASAPAVGWTLVKLTICVDSATGVGNPADSVIQVFARDPGAGNAVRKIRTLDIGDPAVGSTTAGEWMTDINFGPEFSFQASVDLRFSVSVTPTAGSITVVGFALTA